jgi:hypothetical protein
LVGLHRTTTTLEVERTSHDADGERTFGLGNLGNDRCGTRTRSATFAGGDEHHVGACEMFLNFVTVSLGCLTADLGITPCTKSTRQFASDVDLVTRIAHDERLGVGVDGNEVDPAQSGIDHSVHGVDATAADTHHFDDRDRRVLRVTWHDVSHSQVEHEAQPLLQAH